MSLQAYDKKGDGKIYIQPIKPITDNPEGEEENYHTKSFEEKEKEKENEKYEKYMKYGLIAFGFFAVMKILLRK